MATTPSMIEEYTAWDGAVTAALGGDLAGALRLLRGLARPTARSAYNIGLCEAAAGRCAAAVQCFDEACSRDEHFAMAFFQRGVVHYKLQDDVAALRDFAACAGKFRGRPLIDYHQLGIHSKLYHCEVEYNRACVYVRQGDTSTARRVLEGALKELTEPRHDCVKLALRQIQVGVVPALLELTLESSVCRPNPAKVSNLARRDLLGRKHVVTSDPVTSPDPADHSRQHPPPSATPGDHRREAPTPNATAPSMQASFLRVEESTRLCSSAPCSPSLPRRVDPPRHAPPRMVSVSTGALRDAAHTPGTHTTASGGQQQNTQAATRPVPNGSTPPTVAKTNQRNPEITELDTGHTAALVRPPPPNKPPPRLRPRGPASDTPRLPQEGNPSVSREKPAIKPKPVLQTSSGKQPPGKLTRPVWQSPPPTLPPT